MPARVVRNNVPRTEPIDPQQDIATDAIADLHAKAQAGARRLAGRDTPEGREPLAVRAQDLLIALRDLDVPYNGHSVSLNAGGDVYVHGTPCHPRMVAARLSAGSDVADLTDLVSELHGKLEYEAS